MSLSTSVAQLQLHLDAYAAEVASLLSGKKSAAPRARKHLQQLRELSQKLRAEVLAAAKPEKKSDTDATVVATETVAAAATTLLELASAPTTDTITSPKPKRVRKAAPKKSI